VSCGSIGDVVTSPEYRRQGIATKLLRWCIEEMERDGIAVSYLHTGPQAPLYEKLGWFEVPMTRTYMKMVLSKSEHFKQLLNVSGADQTFHIRRLCLDTGTV
jgi:predicted acetyltransferase